MVPALNPPRWLSFLVTASVLAMPGETAPATRWCDLLPRPGNARLPRVDLPDDWFVVYKVGDGVFAICEPYQFQEVISYLILGSRSALLFDTGLGIGAIARVVKKLTSLPVTVLNSHTHFDHVGGNADFHRLLAMDTDYTRANARGFPHERVQGEVAPGALCRDLPSGFDPRSPNAVQESYAFTYYPGALDIQEAAAIEIQPGVNLTAIDFTVPRQLPYKIRGRVIDSRSGQRPGAVTIQARSESPTGESEIIAFSSGSVVRGNASYNATDGSFEIRNVVPGSYVVKAEIPGGQQDARPGPVPGASALVTVSNSDINSLMLNILPPVSMSGHLTIEGGELSTMQDFDRIRVRLIPADRLARSALPNSPQSQTLNPDGTFRIDNVKPGQYQVMICMALASNSSNCARNTPNFYLKDARFDHMDVLNRPLQFAGIAPTPLDIVLSRKPGRIEGVVMNDKRQPVAGIRTVLISDQNRDRIGLYKFAETDQAGRFTIRGITPGAYKVFAWEALEENAYFDSDLMQRFEAYGTPVRVSESDELPTEVKLIPAGM